MATTEDGISRLERVKISLRYIKNPTLILEWVVWLVSKSAGVRLRRS